ncbi:MAG TPA: hypothetical protein VMU92_13655 [Acidobacteriaceae bacterium]|nr:hypothetical protein [Acidobacteriaceae bacterium]
MKRLWPFLILTCFLSLGFSAPKAHVTPLQANGPDKLPAILFIAAPTAVPGRLRWSFPQGSHLVRYVPGAPAASAANLTPDFFAVADPQISFDATRVLFAGRKSRRAHWEIWEMKVDGSGLRQIAHCSGDCFQPAYLPHNQIVYTEVSGKGNKQSSAIYVSQSSGVDSHPITFGPGNYRVETVLRSGRLLVSARAALVAGGKDNGSRVFYTLRPDGSGLFLFRWGSRPGYVRSGATELEDGTVLFVKRHNSAARVTGGELALIRPGALHDSVITPGAYVYGSAHVLDGNKLVVAGKDAGSSAATGKFALYEFNLAGKSVGREIYRNPKFSSVEAVPVEASAIPLYYPSMLHLDRDYARVICLNSYLSSGAPKGQLTRRIAKVRVIALGPDARTEHVLGEAAVASDGSFYIKIPADHPVRFELLGESGSVVRAQKSWVWARKGEDMACLGCHENPAIVPRDHFPLALKSFDTPIPIGLPASSQSQKH